MPAFYAVQKQFPDDEACLHQISGSPDTAEPSLIARSVASMDNSTECPKSAAMFASIAGITCILVSILLWSDRALRCITLVQGHVYVRGIDRHGVAK